MYCDGFLGSCVMCHQRAVLGKCVSLGVRFGNPSGLARKIVMYCARVRSYCHSCGSGHPR